MKSIRVSFPLAAILLFGACRGVAGLDDLSFSGETSPGSSSSSSGGSFCEPGALEACDAMYSGPPGTAGVGLCRAPSRVCDNEGTGFGECAGEVVPKAEDCSTAEDEDCDGRAACDGSAIGAKPYGEGADVEICGVAADAAGNLIVAGNFQNTINFGGADLQSPTAKSIFVAKLDGQGAHLWSRMVTGAQEQTCSGIALGPNGNVVLGGYYAGGSPDFGGGPLPPANNVDGFYAKLEAANGEHVWSAAIGGGGDQSVRGFGVDTAGFVFMVGRFQGQISIGKFTLTADAQNETFVAKLASDAAPVLAKRFSASVALHGMKIAVIPATGGAVIAGQIIGTGQFGGTTLTGSGNNQDAFLIRLDPNAGVLWATALVGSNRQQVNSLAIDSSGDVLAAGEFETTVDFGGIPLTATSVDGFVTRLDGAGKAIWARAIGGLNNQVANSVAVDASGAVLTAGTFLSGVALDPNKAPAAGGDDAFIGKLRLDTGATIWLRPFGSLSNETAEAVAVDNDGNAIVSGKYMGDLDLGLDTGPLTSPEGDAYLAKLAP